VAKDKAWKDFDIEMERLRKECDGYQRNLETMREKQLNALDPDISVAEALVKTLRAWEIRDQFRGGVNEDLRVMEAYLEAVENGDDEIADAFESSPVPMLSDEVLSQGVLRRLQKKDPEVAAKIEELEQVHLSVTTTISELMREAATATAYQPAIPITMHGKHELSESELH
jgi:hypothetical protein